MQAVVRPNLPPRRVYRPARAHAGLIPLGHATPSSAGLPSTTSAPSAAASQDVVAFTPGERTFAEAIEAQPTADVTQTTFSAPGTETTPTVTISSEPIRISGVHTLALTPFSATIAWQTSEPVSSRIAYGLDTPSLWTAGDEPSVEHEAFVSGLAFSSSYRLWVTARAADGRSASEPFLLTTPVPAGKAKASTGGGAFRINGAEFFPTIVWNACPDQIGRLHSIGIDLFMANACGDAAHQSAAVGSTGFVLSDALEAPDAAAIGSFLPDEWDTNLPGNLTTAQAERLAPNRGGGPRFLTLTNHFYSLAEPLPQGRGMYPALVETADVLGFDLYPLQNWCRYDSFGDVFEAQRELVTLARGRPTFQWIETRKMDCRDAKLEPTVETVRAETWLAIAGGAHAIGYFPNDWNPVVDGEVVRTKREIQTLLPALMEPALPAQSSNPKVKVSARIHNGAVYLIAVNASRGASTATLSNALLGDRGVVSLAGDRATVAASGAFSDAFAPLEVRVYIAPPTA